MDKYQDQRLRLCRINAPLLKVRLYLWFLPSSKRTAKFYRAPFYPWSVSVEIGSIMSVWAMSQLQGKPSQIDGNSQITWMLTNDRVHSWPPPLILVHMLHPDVNWGEFAAKILLSIGAKTTLPRSYQELRSSRNLKRHQRWGGIL